MRSRPAPVIPILLRDAAVLIACLAAAVHLHRLGSERWAQVDVARPLLWLERTPVEDVVPALLRFAALGTCWWMVGTFVAALLVRAVGWRPAVRVVDRIAPRLVPRLARRLVGGALVATSVLGPATPAVAVGPVSPPVTVDEGFFPPGAAAGSASLEPHRDPGRTPLPTPAGGEERRVRVGPGDHLWGIARAEVARRRGIAPQAVGPSEVAGYWLHVVRANAGRLRSGDPDLLLPGEEIVLPGE